MRRCDLSYLNQEVLSLNLGNTTVPFDRALPPLWSLSAWMKISLGVVWLKCAFHVCTDLLRIPHGLTKKNDIIYFYFNQIGPHFLTFFMLFLLFVASLQVFCCPDVWGMETWKCPLDGNFVVLKYLLTVYSWLINPCSLNHNGEFDLVWSLCFWIIWAVSD